MTTAAEARPTITDSVQHVPITELHLPDDNVRSDIGDVTELARSIEAVGILEPIVVTPREKRPYGFLVVCGSRRVAAAAAAGLERVPAIVRQFTEEQRVEAMIVENLQREDLSPSEEAHAFQRLVDLGHSQRIIASRLGCSQGHVSKRLSLLALPESARAMVDSGGIALELAQELAKLADDPKALAQTVKEVERYPSNAAYAIRGAVRTHEVRRKQAKLLADLDAIGKAAVAMPNHYTAPKGHAIVTEGYGYGGATVRMQPARHRKLACHVVGVAIMYDGVEQLDLCSDPSKHPQESVAARSTPGELAAEKKLRTQREKLDATREGRIAFLKSVCAKPLPKDELLALLLLRTLQDANDFELIYHLLDLEDGDGNVSVASIDDWLDSGGHPHRAAAAVALELFENQLQWSWSEWTRGAIASYFEILEKRGYAISPAERAALDGKAPGR